MFSKFSRILLLLGSSLALQMNKDELLQRIFDKLDQVRQPMAFSKIYQHFTKVQQVLI